MKKNLSLLATLLIAVTVTSCASNKAVEQKVEKEINAVPVKETKMLDATIKSQIAASTLTADQKSQLLALEEKAHAEHTAITEEIEKAKVVMVQTILSPKMSDREFNALKRKITALDKKRLENGFKTAAQVRKIIAPEAVNVQDKEIYKAVIENRLRGF